MPQPLPEAERRRFIDEALKRGAPPERIKRDLSQLEGYAPLSVTIEPGQALTEARLPGGGPPVTPEEQEAGREFFTETVPRVALTTAGGLAAGPGILAGGFGAAAGDIAFQTGRRILTGKPIKPSESLTAGGGAIIGGKAGQIVVRAAGAVGGIAREFLEYAGRSLRPFKRGEGFRLTLGRPAQEAELELGRRIQSTVEGAAKQISAGRLAKEGLIKEATQRGVRVDVRPVINKLREFEIPNATEASAKNFNNRLNKFANELEKRARSFSEEELGLLRSKELAKRVATEAEIMEAPDAELLRKAANILARRPVSGTIGLTPEQFDVLMTKELSPAAFTGTGKPSLNRFSAAIRAARSTAKETLEATIPEVKAANQAAFEELTMREQADAVFGPGNLSLESRLRNLFKPGHEAEQQLLGRIGKDAGIPLLEEAKRLATKRAFTRDDRITAGVLNRVFLLTGTPQIARGIAKIGAPLQRFVGPTTGGLISGFEEELEP